MKPPRHPSDLISLTVLAVVLATAVVPGPAFSTETSSAYHKIKWGDFLGPAPTGNESAEITTGTSSSWGTDTPTGSGTTWKCKLKDVKVTAIMDKKASGVKPGTQTAALLEHEQYHFDISEYWARELEKALKGVEGVGATPAAATSDAMAKANKIEAEMKKKCDDMQELYDSETEHGTNAAKQAAWCTKIGTLLNPPKPKDEKSSTNNSNSNFDPSTKRLALDGLFLGSFSHLNVPFTDPFMQGATLHFPTLVYSGNQMGPTHPLFMGDPDIATDFSIWTQGNLIALSGHLRMLMGDSPDTAYTAWIEEVVIDPLAQQASPFLQFVQASRATGQSVLGLRLSLPVPLSQATNQWVFPANLPASVTVGTTRCDPPIPPILRHPEIRTAPPGSNVAFSVLVAAAGPFNYQWRRNLAPLLNGGNISGADDDTLRIANITPLDVGSYDVLVASACGGVASESGSLAIGLNGVEAQSPLGLRLTLSTPYPNPARSSVAFEVTLPDEAEATVELLDVAGRKLRTQRVGGAGSHSMEFGDLQAIPPGLYFVRAAARAGSTTVRVVFAK